MVKRPKSPEISEDVRYFTIYQPYPLNANWIIEEEQIRCAMWVAECIGAHQHVLAIHYKPKARGMILLEVSKSFTDHGRFLGEHRWSELLKEPNEEEKISFSKVFHSFYARGRDAQKDVRINKGWKVLPIKGHWFKDWEPGQGNIRQPYPPTHWCAVPVEDKTNKPLCRPLPVEQKPPPPRNHLPVVGSEKWVEKHVEGPPTSATLSNAWGKPTITVGTTNQTSLSPPIQTPVALSPQSSGSGLASGSGNNVKFPPGIATAPKVAAKGGWGKPVPLQQFKAPDPRSTKASAWAVVQPAAPSGAKSPLAEPEPKSANAWTKPLKIPPSEKPAAIQGTSTPSSGTNSPWSQPSALPPPSPRGQPASLASAPVSATVLPANDPWSQVDASPKKKKGKANASNGPQSSMSLKGAQQSSSSKNAGKKPDTPPHQTVAKEEEPPLKWSDEPVYFPTSSGPVPELGFEVPEETLEDLEDDFLNPWEAKAAADIAALATTSSAWAGASTKPGDKKKKPSQFDKNGRPAQQGEGDRKGKAKAAGGPGDRGTKPGNQVHKSQKSAEIANNLNKGPAWSVEVTASTSWGDEPLPVRQDELSAELTTSNRAANGNEWNGDAEPPTEPDWNGAAMLDDWGPIPVTTDAAEDWVPDGGWANLWEEVQNDKPPELICPTHNIACKKGICRDMARLVREQERKTREKEWEERRGRGRGRGKGRGGGGRGRGGRSFANTGDAEGDTDGFTEYRRTRRGQKKEPSYIGRMRGFEDVAEANPDGNEADDGDYAYE